jgi:Cu(I)/Ag(I) efflux system membrane protein CusA/SilA
MWLPLVLVILGLNNLFESRWLQKYNYLPGYINIGLVLLIASVFMTGEWMPLGHNNAFFVNFMFVLFLLAVILAALLSIVHFYESILTWCLDNKVKFLMVPTFTILLGVIIWIGFGRTFEFVAKGFDITGWNIRTTASWSKMMHTFPGLGSEFMPSLNEGSYLLMPTSMPHAGIEENTRVVQQLDMRVSSIPEVELAVGKMGRTESALDPAPISMYENVINYKPEYIEDDRGHRITFKVDGNGNYILKTGESISNKEGIIVGITANDLVEDKKGKCRAW